jgi:hypothetical protein
VAEDGHRFLLEGTAGLGQLGARRHTAEQQCAHFALQVPDLLAERRLADADPGGGTGEIPLLGDRQEVADVA